jgi:hypothetical protein
VGSSFGEVAEVMESGAGHVFRYMTKMMLFGRSDLIS